MSFKKLVITLFIFSTVQWGWSQNTDSRKESLKEIYKFHMEVIDSLVLSTGLKPLRFKEAQDNSSSGGSSHKKPTVIATVPFVPKNLTVKRNTVFGNFNVQIIDFGEHFTLNIHSENPAEEVLVKDSKRNIVLFKHSLNDETDFTAQVNAPLSRDIGVSIAVVQSGSINDAYFKILGE